LVSSVLFLRLVLSVSGDYQVPRCSMSMVCLTLASYSTGLLLVNLLTIYATSGSMCLCAIG
jgi:hypothetical protein